MIPFSAKEIIRVPVDQITYLVAVPTLLTRASYRREVASLGAIYHSDSTMLNALRDGVRDCVADRQQGELIEIINSFEIEQEKLSDLGDEATDTERESLDDLRNRVDDIERFMQREYDRYSEMAADRGYWLSIAPIIAFRQFVTGWEGGELQYKSKRGQVCESLMDSLPSDHIDIVGWKAITLMSPSGGQEKNSESQSQSPQDPKTLTAEESPQIKAQAGI